MSSATLGSTARESASAYDRWAPDYDHCENKTRDLDGIALRAQDLDMAGKEVVEFGCGTGRHTKHFLDKFGEHIVKYTAMDASEVIDAFFFSQFEMVCYVCFKHWFGLIYLEVHVKSHGSFFTNSWVKETCSAFLSSESLHDRDPHSWLDTPLQPGAPLSLKMILTQ